MEDKKTINKNSQNTSNNNKVVTNNKDAMNNIVAEKSNKQTNLQSKITVTTQTQSVQKQPQVKTAQKAANNNQKVSTGNSSKPANSNTSVKTQNVKSQSPKTDSAKNQNSKENSTDVKNEIKKVNQEIAKTKNEIELIGIFIKLEKNLVDVLQTIPKDVSEEGLDNEKANIKSYMKKVELARKLFDEYENTAKLITNLSESKENDLESIEISKKVMEIRDGKQQKSNIDEKDLLRQVQAIEKQSKGLDKVEIEMLGDTVVVKKKKSYVKEKSM